jgi:MFS family permease
VPVIDISGTDEHVAAGAMLAAFGAATTASAATTGRVIARWGVRGPIVLALALLALSELTMGLGAADHGLAAVTVAMLIGGAGFGLSGTALYNTGLGALEERDAGVASGVLWSGRYVGAIVAASLFAAFVGDAATGDDTNVEPLLLVAAGLAALGMVLALRLPARVAHEHRLG